MEQSFDYRACRPLKGSGSMEVKMEKVLKERNQKEYGSVFQLEGTPKFSKALPLALQHVVAMIVGCVTPALMVASIGKLSPDDTVVLVQGALVIAAVATLIQLFPIGGVFGSGLPVIMGVSFAYVPTMQAIAEGYDIGTIMGSQIVGGICAVFVGIFVKKLRILFPTLITGTVVFTIGLSLYPTAIQYMAGGVSNPEYGSWQNWMIAFITLITVTGLNHFGKGIFKLASILIGIITGYIISLCFGMVNFQEVINAGYIQVPKPLYFGINFNVSCCVSLGILFVINSVQAIGDFSATTAGGLDREPTDNELQRGIVAYGCGNIFGAFFGGLPTATYSQNVGIVATTKVVNRKVLGLSALIILSAGLLPKFSALLTTIPQCVLGGATIAVFASIAMTGIKLIVQQPLTYRNTSIVGLSVALGMGITQASSSLSSFPVWVTTIFGKSPVVIATISAIVLNIILPRNEREADKKAV